jgi:hypothetical protein
MISALPADRRAALCASPVCRMILQNRESILECFDEVLHCRAALSRTSNTLMFRFVKMAMASSIVTA